MTNEQQMALDSITRAIEVIIANLFRLDINQSGDVHQRALILAGQTKIEELSDITNDLKDELK